MDIRGILKRVITIGFLGICLLIISQVLISDLLFNWEYNLIISVVYIPIYYLWLRYGCNYFYKKFLNDN